MSSLELRGGRHRRGLLEHSQHHSVFRVLFGLQPVARVLGLPARSEQADDCCGGSRTHIGSSLRYAANSSDAEYLLVILLPQIKFVKADV